MATGAGDPKRVGQSSGKKAIGRLASRPTARRLTVWIFVLESTVIFQNSKFSIIPQNYFQQSSDKEHEAIMYEPRHPYNTLAVRVSTIVLQPLKSWSLPAQQLSYISLSMQRIYTVCNEYTRLQSIVTPAQQSGLKKCGVYGIFVKETHNAQPIALLISELHSNFELLQNSLQAICTRIYDVFKRL